MYGLLENGVAEDGVRAVEVAEDEVDVVDGILGKLLYLKWRREGPRLRCSYIISMDSYPCTRQTIPPPSHPV